jgi:tripartite-type tricarboxylate transporter receptor subunit TctC
MVRMKKMMKLGAAVLVLTLVGVCQAQDYPSRAVRVVVPFAPGGSVDIFGRLVSQKLTERWGRPVLVENRAGAGGNLGAETVAKSAPDGYTLLVAGIPHAIGVTLYQKPTYDFAKDLQGVGNIGMLPSVIVTHPSLPVKTIKDLIALAAARPGQLTFGSGGNGSPNHLTLELVNFMAKVNMVHVPYKGGGQVVGDLVAGHIQLASIGIPAVLSLVQTGKLRAIAVTGSQRSAVMEKVPTVAESGLPGFDVTSWYGLFSPANTQAAVIAKVNKDLGDVLMSADIKERFAAMGADPSVMRPDEFSNYVRNEISKWEKVIKAAGIK